MNQGFSAPFINVYPLDLNATEAQQTTISGLRGLPASMKLAFGFISDNFPLLGYRRKSYMLIGWATASISMLALLMLSDLRLIKHLDEETGKTITYTNDNAPTVPVLSCTILMSGIGYWLADVMADTLVVSA